MSTMTTPSPRKPRVNAGSRALGLIAAAVLGLAPFIAAHADSGRLMLANVPGAYTQECASCHTAYPPGLLPAPSWQRLMGSLDKHFGTDASLDVSTAQQIGAWLQAHAGTYKRVREAPPQDRITRSAWFERKHGGIDRTVWKLPSVGSPARCAACHTGADRGDYGDDRLQFPAGLDARLRRPWND